MMSLHFYALRIAALRSRERNDAMETTPALTDVQKRQIEKQMALHRSCKKPFAYPPIELDSSTLLEGLIVHPGVLWPMSSKRLASFLFRSRAGFKDKSVIDMGSGSGLQGVVAALYGAATV